MVSVFMGVWWRACGCYCCGTQYLLSFQHKKIKSCLDSCSSSTPAPFVLKKELNVVQSNFIFSKIKIMKIRKYVVISRELPGMSLTRIIVDALHFGSCLIRLYTYLLLILLLFYTYFVYSGRGLCIIMITSINTKSTC